MARDGWRWEDAVDAMQQSLTEESEFGIVFCLRQTDEVVHLNFEPVEEGCSILS